MFTCTFDIVHNVPGYNAESRNPAMVVQRCRYSSIAIGRRDLHPHRYALTSPSENFT